MSGYVWLNLVEAVSDLTKYNFGQLFEMSAMEFFTYVAYIKYKQKKEEQRIKEFKRKNKV